MNKTVIRTIIEKYEQKASEWDGDEAGIGEERASIANDIIGTAKELLSLIEEFENL